MSKLVDKLCRFSKPSPQMGFRRASSESAAPTMLLIAGISDGDVTGAKAIASSDVDAGLIFEQIEMGNLSQMTEATGSIPMGVFLGEGNSAKVAEIATSGCDFVVFDVKALVETLEIKELGKFLAVEMSSGYDLIRPIGELEVDGVILVNREPVLAIEHLLLCRRFGSMITKPILVEVASPTKADVSTLWEAGVDGIVVPPGKSLEQLSKLRETIASLPQRRRRSGKIEVTLPHYGGMAVEEEEAEEEEGEEEI